MRSWLDNDINDMTIDPGHHWFCVLDDAELFDVPDWPDVYDVLPELAAPRPDRRFIEEHIEWAQSVAKRRAENDPDEYEDMDEHYADAIRQTVTIGGSPWLIVLDEEAFRTEELGLIFRDKKGNAVKQSEIEPYRLDEFHGRSERVMTYEGWWEHAFVPKKYRVRGKIMRTLLPLVKAQDGLSEATSD